MKKFAFSLEALLKIKVSMEKQLKNQQSKVLSSLKSIDQRMQCVEDQKTDAKKAYLSMDCMSADNMKIFRMHYKSLEDKRLQMKRQAEELKMELAQIQKQLMDVTVEKKTLEKLKQKQYELYMVEYKKEQDKEMDDILSCLPVEGRTGY